jgi:hypothetical protein
VADLGGFSKKLLDHPEAKNAKALARIAVAKKRVLSVLDRNLIANQKTLEQKISEQGPNNQRVDPHLVGLAVMDLLEQNRLQKRTHKETSSTPWYSTITLKDDVAAPRLEVLAPLYAKISTGNFNNLIGDALELITFKCLESIFKGDNRYAFQGAFLTAEPKDAFGRYRKISPPKHIATHITKKEADFLQFGHAAGPMCIECKNYRQWTYPHEHFLKELIVKSAELNAAPVLVARRIHYTTITNFLQPAGIIAHETLFQYFPADQEVLAASARDKNLLGFTDIRAEEIPHPRTMNFFSGALPKVADYMTKRWQKNKAALLDFANGEINLPQLYTEIGSPAGGKWLEPEDLSDVDPFD